MPCLSVVQVSACQSVCLSVCLSECLNVSKSGCLSQCLSVSISHRLSHRLSHYLSHLTSHCLSVSISVISVSLLAQRPGEDWLHHSKQQLQASLDFAVAGRAATETAFEAGGVTAGAMDDFKQATSLARAMVTQYGMSDTLGRQLRM